MNVDQLETLRQPLDNYSDYTLRDGEKNFHISIVLNFCLNFIQNKFFDMPQSFESKMRTSHQLQIIVLKRIK